MSFEACINAAVAVGDISPEMAARLKTRYAELEADAIRRMGDGREARDAARETLAKQLEAEGAEKKRKAAIAIRVHDDILAKIGSYRDRNGRQDVAGALVSLLENTGFAGYDSVKARADTIATLSHARLEELLYQARLNVFRFKRLNDVDATDIVRTLRGETVADERAVTLARSYKDVRDGLFERRRQAGGTAEALDNYGLPQVHDATKMIGAGRAKWKADIAPRLDRDAMTDPRTGERMTDAQFDRMLDHVYDSIVMDGWNTRDPVRRPAGGDGAARDQQRFLKFRTADDWFAYNDAYGQGDLWAAMIEDINALSRDIAAMEILGPSPAATVAWMKQVIEQEGAKAKAGKPSLFRADAGDPTPWVADRIDDGVGWRTREIDGTWAQLSGAANVPAVRGVAVAGSVIRNWITAARLGSAVVSAVTSDPAFAAAARLMNGLPTATTVQRIVAELMNGPRSEALRFGIAVDDALHVMRDNARYAGLVQGPEWSRWLPDVVMNVQGLTAWTQAGRVAFGKDFMGALAERAGQTFDQLDEPIREALRRYGVTADEWDVARKTALYEPVPGATYLRPMDVADRAIGEKLHAMILTETERAVPSGTLRGRAAFIGTTQGGSLAGELVRSVAMFKSFSASILMMHFSALGRMLSSRNHAAAGALGVGMAVRGAAYAGAMFVVATLGGAATTLIRDVLSGRDPRPTDNPAFWGQAALAGGGLGLFGDYLFADVNRYGQSFPETLVGPVPDLMNDVLKLTVGNAWQASQGDNTHVGRESVDFLRKWTPGGSLWFARAAYNRVLLDQLQWAADPEAHRAFRAIERRAFNERGQEFWWGPGDVAPERAPDLGAFLEPSPVR